MIAVTGVGAASVLGWGAEALFDGLLAGRAPFSAAPWGSEGTAARLPDEPVAAAMALAAAREALHGLDDPEGLAVVGGSTAGHMRLGEVAWEEVLRGGIPDDRTQYVWRQLCHEPTRLVRDALKATGPCLTLSTACTSGAAAIGVAADLVTAGRSRRALAIGVDALCRTTLDGFGCLGVRSTRPCRPFDRDRDGMSLGEGAGALLLEDLETAQARGAVPLAVLSGYGNASDAYHLTAPHPEGRGARTAIRAALGALPGATVDFVCAHATGTTLNDQMEARVLRETTPNAAVGAYKGALGHTLGAAGALEAVIAVLVLQRGRIPPSTGLVTPDPAADGLDLVREAREAQPTWALSVNFAFGGNNTALLFQRAP
ncbi:MAG: beta-ketoacyl-[acyl-carrier-protein] synthase family protein [Deltaproteobacteria bacterium]|nr:beta-ketoacyl-[acyl-carrier-protein] synthase family protein [Deltaproteobacteria bacterium]